MPLATRTPTAVEKEWLALAYQIPCLACSLFHDTHDSPAEYHHIRGRTEDGAHLDGFSLCSRHHRHRDNYTPARWVSRHGDGRTLFEREYMSEQEFLTEMQKRVEALKGRIIGN